MNYVVYTETGKSPSFDDIFGSGLLNIKLEKDIKNKIGFIILHPGQEDEIIISFDISGFNNTNGGNRIKKKITKSKKYMKNTSRKGKSKKYMKNTKQNAKSKQKFKKTRKTRKKYNLVGGIKINKPQILLIVAFLLNFFLFPIVLPGDNEKGPRSDDFKVRLTTEQERIIDNIKIEVIPGTLSIEDLNIQTVGTLKDNDPTNIDIFRRTMNSNFSDLIYGKDIAIANINNPKFSPTYQLSNFMPKLTFPDVGFTKFTYSPNTLYGITANWHLNKEIGTFNIELYNMTESSNLANLPENKQLYTLVKNTINEQLQNMNVLGMIPQEASEGWFDLYLGQFAPKSQVTRFNSPYHFDGHSTLMDTNLGLNNPRSDDLELEALRDKIRFTRPYGRNESLTLRNTTTFYVSPFSSIQTMTYGSPSNEDRATFKKVNSNSETGIVMEGEEGGTTTYIPQEKAGIQHAAMSGNTVPFPFSAGKVRYLMLGNMMPKLVPTQEVDPNIIKNKITTIDETPNQYASSLTIKPRANGEPLSRRRRQSSKITA